MVPALLLPFTLAAHLAAAPATSAPSVHVSAARAPVEAALPALQAAGDRARRLTAELLVDADSVDLVAADRSSLRFALERAGVAYRLDIALGSRGRVDAVTLRRAARHELGEGELSWIGLAIGDRERVTAAAVGDDGVVVLLLEDGTALPLTPEAGDDYVGC